MILKIKDKEFNIAYGIEATSKSNIFSKMIKIETEMAEGGQDSLSQIDDFALLIAELLLIGLQRNHRDEFSYDYNTLEGKDEQISKTCAMLDDYLEDETKDCFELYHQLEQELQKNGFLRSLFKSLKEAAEKENKNKKKAKLEVVAES